MSCRAFIFFVTLIGIVLATSSLSAQDSVIGKSWEITYRKNGKPQYTRQFRATLDGKVHNRFGKRIGVYVEKGNQVRCVIDDTDIDRGTLELIKVPRKPHPWWAGTFTRENGTKCEVRLRLLAD